MGLPTTSTAGKQLPLRSRATEGLHPQGAVGRHLRIHLRRGGPPDEGRGACEVWHLHRLGEEAQARCSC
jgi:hypothetical protein